MNSSTISSTLRHGLLALVTCMLLSAALFWRAHRAGTAALLESDEAFDRGQLSLSVSKAADALRWYFPFAQHVQDARSRLVALAEGAEATGDLQLALSAWGALRASLNETAHGLSGPDPLLDKSGHALVRLLPRPEGLMAPAPDNAQLLAAYAEPVRSPPVFYIARSLGMGLLLVGVWFAFLRHEQKGYVFGLGCLGCGLFAWVFAALGA